MIGAQQLFSSGQGRAAYNTGPTCESGMSDSSPTGVTATQPFRTAQESVPSVWSLEGVGSRSHAGCGEK